MIVTGGGMELESKQIKELKGDFLTRQRFMASKFKQFFFKELFTKVSSDELDPTERFNGDKDKFFTWAREIRDKHWVVSIQKPLDDIAQIVGYVGRYTKRACLSEYKIESWSSKEVKIRFNDYKNTPKGEKPRQSIKTFTNEGFFDALLQHVPIEKFKMVRYYGLYSSHYRAFIQEHVKRKVTASHTKETQWVEFEKYRELTISKGKPDPLNCINCNKLMTESEVIYNPNFRFDDT